MLTVYVGLPGNGKSVTTANKAVSLLKRNKRNIKKYGVTRILWSNLHFSKEIEERFKGLIRYWKDPIELLSVENADIIWDEISRHLDSTQWQNTPVDLKGWFQQHDKVGVDIYANTQDFATVDVSARRVAEHVIHIKKLIGSRRPSNTKPPVTNPWGLIVPRHVDRKSYNQDTVEYTFTSPLFFDLLNSLFITKANTSVFDTHQKIESGQLPHYRHIERQCSDPKCKYHKILHI